MKKVSAVNYQMKIFVHPKIVGLFNQLVYFYVKKKSKKTNSITQNNSLHTTSHNFYPLSSHSGISKLTLHVEKKIKKVIYNTHCKKLCEKAIVLYLTLHK